MDVCKGEICICTLCMLIGGAQNMYGDIRLKSDWFTKTFLKKVLQNGLYTEEQMFRVKTLKISQGQFYDHMNEFFPPRGRNLLL